jgi:dihydroxyacetone kinase
VLLSCANIFESCGGSLCILLALFLTSAASSFRKNLDSLQKTANDVSRLEWLKLWSGAINKGLETVEEYGRARPGQRSIVDPLDALNRYLKSEIAKRAESASNDLEQDDLKPLFQQMVDVTFETAQATAHMKPMVGRASYVDPALIKNPDAGAFAISVVVSLIYKAFLTGDVK